MQPLLLIQKTIRKAQRNAFKFFAAMVLAPLAVFASKAPTVMSCGSVPSAILKRPVGYCVDLPADYAAHPHRRYPVIYYLHGLFENDRSWDDNGGKAVLDAMLAKGEIGDFIVAMPNARLSFYVNSYSGKVQYEDFFIREFVPFIDHTYRTIPSRRDRAIDGDSMGGYGSLHLGMKYANVFGVACALIPALIAKLPNPFPPEFEHYQFILEMSFGNPLNEAYWEANSPLTLAQDPKKFRGLKIYFEAADADRFGFEQGAAQLDQILTQEHVPHFYALRPGGHNWDFVDAHMKSSLLYAWKHMSHAPSKPTALRQSKAN